MLYIRQGATHKIVLGPAVAVGDGFTPVTTLTLSGADEAEAILHDNGTVVDISGYTFAAITTADGYYHLTLQSGISNTVGHLTIVVNDDSLILPLRADFTVLEEAVYDMLFAGSALGYVANAPVNIAQLGGDAQSLTDLKDFADAGYDPSTKKVQGVVLVDTTTAITNGVTLADDAITAAKFDQTTAFPLASSDGSDLTEAGGTGDHLTAINLPNQTMDITGNITGNLSGSVGSVTGNVGGSIGSLGAQAKLDVNAEADTAISDAALATAANLATVAGYVDTEIQTILTNLATAQADLDILTGTDGVTLATTQPNYAPSTLDAAGVRTAVGLAAANLDTQLGDLPTNAELTTALSGIPKVGETHRYTNADTSSTADVLIEEVA